MTGIEAPMRQLIEHVVEQVPGVSGALVSSADGFVLASRLPERDSVDPPAVAAMSAAVLGIADRLVQLTGEQPATLSHQRSPDGQVFVFAVGGIAVLTLLTDESADAEQIRLVGKELSGGLQRLFRGAAQV